MDSSIFFLLLTVALLVFRRPLTAVWNELSSRPLARSTAAFLVLLILLVARDPELRAFLVVVDYIGADIFMLLLFFQGREILLWSGTVVWQPAMRFLEARSWWPLPLPSWALFKQYPGWSVLAVAQAVAVTFICTAITAGVAVSLPRL